jgi:dimethylargininase
MGAGSVRHALVRPVPDSYDRCIRTNREKIDVALARSQHDEYCRALQKLGLSLTWIRGDNALPDSCFVEDTAVVFEEKAVICNIGAKSRAKEVVEVAKVMEKLKETYRIKPPATIDGGDVLRVEDRVFVGISARTNLHAVTQLKKILENTRLSVVPVKVHGVLHLKSACTYLGNGVVILSRGCFDTNVLHGLRKITVPKGEEYAADCLAVNKTVLIAKGHAETKKRVEQEGFRVEELEMSEFRKGDGALTCLSIIL